MTTTSLQTSRLLKENGYPQESSFWWWEDNFGLPQDRSSSLNDHKPHNPQNGWAYFAAPTADEILDMLPARITNPNTRNMDFLRIHPGDDSKQDNRQGYTLEYHTAFSAPLVRVTDNSLADAAAKMWLYLKREGLLK